MHSIEDLLQDNKHEARFNYDTGKLELADTHGKWETADVDSLDGEIMDKLFSKYHK